MTPDGKFLAATTHDGRVNIYDTTKINEEVKAAQTLAQFETKGSFGACVDIVRFKRNFSPSPTKWKNPLVPNRPTVPQRRNDRLRPPERQYLHLQQHHAQNGTLAQRAREACASSRFQPRQQVSCRRWRCAGHCNLRHNVGRAGGKLHRACELGYEFELELEWGVFVERVGGCLPSLLRAIFMNLWMDC